jgi:acetamidase/formamidase
VLSPLDSRTAGDGPVHPTVAECMDERLLSVPVHESCSFSQPVMRTKQLAVQTQANPIETVRSEQGGRDVIRAQCRLRLAGTGMQLAYLCW